MTQYDCAGFFADKDADAKARGEDVKKKSKEEEFSDFMSSIAVDVREACFHPTLEGLCLLAIKSSTLNLLSFPLCLNEASYSCSDTGFKSVSCTSFRLAVLLSGTSCTEFML